MSSATTPGNDRYVDFDEYVEFQLDKTRKSIKTNDLMTAIAGALAFVLGGALAFVVLDHWVISGGFSVFARWCWFLVFSMTVIGWLVWKIGLPALFRVNRLYAAKELEDADPALKSNLLNWVDLRDAGRKVHPAVMQTIEKQAATELSKMDVGQAVDHRPLLKASYALLAAVVLFCGYALMSPKRVSSALWRMLPFTQAGVVTRTEILEVTPGDTVLLSRGQLDVGVALSGEIPSLVEMRYTTSDGRIQDEAVVLRPESEGGARFRGVFAGENGRGVLQDFTYYVVAGDAQSRRYRVKVQQPPSATVQEVSLRFPDYMKLGESTISGGNIDGWEGAVATISATADKPCKSAVLQFLNDPQSPPTGEEFPVEVTDGTQLKAQWTLGFRSDNTYPKHYRIVCRNDEGQADPSPTVYSIAVKPDRPPEVVLLHPERDLTAPANAVIPLLVQASDPDFELEYVNLHADKDGALIHRYPLSEGLQQKLTLEYDFDLKQLGLQAGDEIEFWVEAIDNRQPRRNRKNTPRLKIRIEEPVSKEEAAQQLAENKQERQDRLDEAEREENGDQHDRQPRDMQNEEREQDADAREREREEQENASKREKDNTDSQTEDGAQSGSDTQSGEGEKGQTGQGSQAGGEKGEKSGTGQQEGTGEDSSSEGPLNSDGADDDKALEKLNNLLNQSEKSNSDQPKKNGGEQKPNADQPMPPSKDGATGEENASDNSPENPSNGSASDATDSKKGKNQKQPTLPKPGENEKKSSDPMPSEKDGASSDEDPSEDPSQNPRDESPQDGTDSKKGKSQKQPSLPKPGDKPSGDPNESQPGEGDEGDPGEMQDATDKADAQSKPKTGSQDKSGDKPKPGQSTGEKGDGAEPMPGEESSSDGAETESDPNAESKAKPAKGKQSPKDDPSEKPGMKPDKSTAKQDKSGKEGDAKDSDKEPKEKPAPGDQVPKDGLNKDNKNKQDTSKSKSDPQEQQNSQEKGNESGPSGGGDESPMPSEDGASESSEGGDSEASDSASKPSSNNQSSSKSKPKAGKLSKSDGQKSSQSSESESSDSDSSDSEDGGSDQQSNSGDKPGDKDKSSAAKSKADSKKKSEQQKPGAKKSNDKSSPKGGNQDQENSQADEGSDGSENRREGDMPGEEESGDKPEKTKPGKPDPNARKTDLDNEQKSEKGVKADPKKIQPSDGEAESADEELKGEGEKDGQKSKQPQKGEQGGSAQDKQGSSGSKTEGPGEDTQEAGQEKVAKQKTGKSDPQQRPGEGSEMKPGNEAGEQQGDKQDGQQSSKSEGGKESGGGEGEGTKGNSQGSSSKSGKPHNGQPGEPGKSPSPAANPTSGDARGNGTSGPGGNAADADADPEAANLDYNRQAAELVLQRLKDDLNEDNVDPKLLEELGWTPDQLQRFVDRLAKQLERPAGELTPQDEARRKQFEAMLKTLDLKNSGAKRQGEKSPQREVDQSGGRRAPVPNDYKSAYEAFTKSLNKQKPAKTEPKRK